MKIKSTIVFMFLTIALIIPIGVSYATYDNSPAFTPPAPSASTPENQTNTNMTMTTTPSENQTNTNMTMTTTPSENQTNTNMTMTTTPSENQTNTNMTMTTTPSENQTNTNMTMTTTPSENQTNTNMPSHPLDPLKQFKSGVTAKDVQCQSGFSLVLKASDGSPACVHSSTVQILVQRGWAVPQ